MCSQACHKDCIKAQCHFMAHAIEAHLANNLNQVVNKYADTMRKVYCARFCPHLAHCESQKRITGTEPHLTEVMDYFRSLGPGLTAPITDQEKNLIDSLALAS